MLSHIEEQAGEVENHASLTGFSTVTSGSAEALITIAATSQGRTVELDFELSMYKRGAGWCANSFGGPASYTRG